MRTLYSIDIRSVLADVILLMTGPFSLLDAVFNVIVILGYFERRGMVRYLNEVITSAQYNDTRSNQIELF